MKNYKTVMLGSVATSALLLGAAAITTPALAKNVEVGHKKGSFYLKTKDGKFSVITGAQMQIIYIYKDNDDERTGAANNSETSFSARRIRFGVKGRAGHKKLTYRVSMNLTTNSEADVDEDGDGFAIFDSYLQWKFSKALALRVGTWKQRFTESHSNSAGKLQMVDRARGTGNIGRIERDTGLGINGKLFKMLSYEASIINGNTRKSPDKNANQSFVGSLKIQPFGKFGAAYEGDIKNNKKLKVMVAAAGFYKDNVTFSTRGNQNTFISLAGNADIVGWTVGGGVKWRGFGLYGEYVEQRFHDANNGDGNPNTVKVPGEKLQAYNIEASYFLIPKKWSVAGRYERFMVNTRANDQVNHNVAPTEPAGPRALIVANQGPDGEYRYGIGTSYFFRGQAHKIVADWIRTHDVGGGKDSTGASTNVDDNTFSIQWQTRF